MDKQFISYYEKIGFAPTGIDPSKKHKLTPNRANLYRKLGLPPQFFHGLNCLEIGPGSGDNTKDLLQRGVRSVSVVDLSTTVIGQLKTKLPEVNCIVADAYDPINFGRFDFVLIEGVLPFQLDPVKMYLNALDSLEVNGVLVGTAADEISSLSELLRRFYVKSLIVKKSLTVNQISELLAKDFSFLPGMTRDPIHWVHDSILNPWMGETFSITKALVNLPENFRPYSFSPNFFEDTVWYKNLSFNHDLTAQILSQFQTKRMFAIDTRVGITNQNYSRVTNFKSICREIFDLVTKSTEVDITLKRTRLFELLELLQTHTDLLDVRTLDSLISFSRWLQSDSLDDLKEFKPFWGRGQIHFAIQKTDI